MAIAKNSADQRRLSREKGIPLPSVNSGMNKIPSKKLTVPTDDSRAETAYDSGKPDITDAEILETAKKRFRDEMTVEAANRTDGIEDLKFLNGEQWSQADATARASDGRPCVTENRLPTFANQITNDQRQNRPSINISPMGDKSTKKDAKMLRGMIRAIERDSHADVAYDTGFASSVHNGWGYWRVITEYESENSFNKVIVIRPLANPMNVVLDPNRTQFMLDSKWGFISEMIPKEEFKEEYPDAYMMPWDENGIGDSNTEWVTEEEIRVAEYYEIVTNKRTLVMLDTGFTGYKDELAESVKENIKKGSIEILAEREVFCKQLKWYKLTASEILECQDCDGSYIPIIECNGTVFNINGTVTKKGIVRDAKGPQRMANYYSTLEAENVALQPKAPWIMEEGQIEGHETKWQQANKKSFPYLLYRGVNLNGAAVQPPQRQPFQGPPAAILAAKQGNIESLRAVTGIRFDATMSERMQDESGRAIRELNNNANLGAYHYIDNYGRALKNTAIIIVDLIPYVYDTKRIVETLDEGGNEDNVMINPDIKEPHGEIEYGNASGKIKLFNPKVGRYKVAYTIGPSYATRRIEAAESQMDFLKSIPTIAPLVADLIAKNSDWDGAEEMANRLAKSVPPEMLQPDREDMSPQIQAFIQSQQQQMQQMTQQMQAMQKELEDRQKDRDVLVHQTDMSYKAKNEQTMSDFKVSIMNMQKDMKETMMTLSMKMEEIQQKKEATFHGTVGRAIAELSKQIGEIRSNSTGGVPPG